MTVTRYSALSITVDDTTGQSTLVGGPGCVTNEADLTTYYSYVNNPSAGAGAFHVDFGAVPDLHTADRVELHIVASGTGTYAPPGVSISLTPPLHGYIVDAAGNGTSGDVIGLIALGDSTNVIHLVSIQSIKEFNTSAVNASDILFKVTAMGATNLKIYGAYLVTAVGTNPVGLSPSASPYVAFGLASHDVVSLDQNGVPLLATNCGTNQAWAVPFTNGMLALGGYISALYVVSADGVNCYSSMTYDAEAATPGTDLLGREYSVLGLRESATVLLCWSDYVDDPSYATMAVAKFSQTGQMLSKLLVRNGGWLPVGGDELNGKLYYLAGGANYPNTASLSNLSASNIDGLHVLDLGSGVDTRITTASTFLGLGTRSGNGSPSTLCLDTTTNTLLAAQNDALTDPESGFWISRWSLSGVFLGKLGFRTKDRNGTDYWSVKRYGGAGGLVVCSDGRLIFFWSGSIPASLGYSDAVMQIAASAVPSDGSTAYATLGTAASPGNASVFYRIPNGLQQGSGAQHVFAPIRASSGTASLVDRKVHFS